MRDSLESLKVQSEVEDLPSGMPRQHTHRTNYFVVFHQVEVQPGTVEREISRPEIFMNGSK